MQYKITIDTFIVIDKDELTKGCKTEFFGLIIDVHCKNLENFIFCIYTFSYILWSWHLWFHLQKNLRHFENPKKAMRMVPWLITTYLVREKFIKLGFLSVFSQHVLSTIKNFWENCIPTLESRNRPYNTISIIPFEQPRLNFLRGKIYYRSLKIWKNPKLF